MPQRVVIVSPALSDANNGNWQTARRWQGFLQSQYAVRIVKAWPDEQAQDDAVMLALHAKRSAPAIQAWAQRHGAPAEGSPGLGVVLTGTDLYRDIQEDASAQQSLRLARQLVVLQPLGVDALPADLKARTRVIIQSTRSRQAQTKTQRHLRALMVGHLRAEKDPQTLMACAGLLQKEEHILIDHVGAALDDTLGQQARHTMQTHPHYRWLGALPHEATRKRIAAAHVLVHASRMEGGAHVVMEAVCSGTPVIASRIDGNVGMLGADYDGYFEAGDAQGLAQCLKRAAHERGFLQHLARQCALRAPLFAPQAERSALLDLVSHLIHKRT